MLWQQGISEGTSSMYVRCLRSNLLINHRHVSCVGRSLHLYLFIPVCLLNMNIYYGVAQNTYPVCAEHCHWNTRCTANASSTRLSSQHCGRCNNTLTNQWTCVCTQGPRDSEGAHKCKQRNRSSAQPGVKRQSSVTFTMFKCEKKASWALFWPGRCQMAIFCKNTHTCIYIILLCILCTG